TLPDTGWCGPAARVWASSGGGSRVTAMICDVAIDAEPASWPSRSAGPSRWSRRTSRAPCHRAGSAIGALAVPPTRAGPRLALGYGSSSGGGRLPAHPQGPDHPGAGWHHRRRRVLGLRREEVAMLAGVSVEYYARMERGDLRGVSLEVLDALARTLQLDEAETD